MATYYYRGGMGGPRRFSLFPPVIKSLLIANIAVFLVQTVLELLSYQGASLDSIATRLFALWPLGSGNLYPWQILSYQFMHGGITHLLFNMFALWMFGVELESAWGGKRFLVYYLLSGIGAGIVHLVVSFVSGQTVLPTVGASGAIFGVLLAFGLTFPNRPIIMFPIFFPIPARIFVLIYAGIDLVLGFTRPDSGVAHFAHLGGALTGFILLKFGDTMGVYTFFDKIIALFSNRSQVAATPRKRKIYRVDNEARESTAAPQWFRTAPTDESASNQQHSHERLFEPTKGISQEQIDQILDKISRYGYNSLTDVEKAILYEASKKF